LSKKKTVRETRGERKKKGRAGEGWRFLARVLAHKACGAYEAVGCAGPSFLLLSPLQLSHRKKNSSCTISIITGFLKQRKVHPASMFTATKSWVRTANDNPA
jgi:hypothetical protein